MRPFAMNDLSIVRLDDDAAGRSADALMLPFSLVHAVHPSLLRTVVDQCRAVCVNEHAVTFSSVVTVLHTDGGRAVARIRD